MTQAPSSLFNYTREELYTLFQKLDIPSYRADQIWKWVYQKGVRSFEDMSNIPQSMKESLSHLFHLNRPNITKALASKDGTQKWLLALQDQKEIEAVHIPDVDRGTLCISSQVGCTLTCKFCHTGTQLLVRNLEGSELVSQIMVAKDIFDEWSLKPQHKRYISNIVMMGMGEPLYNYENVSKGLKILMDQHGLAISKRKITLSTSGVIPMMRQCGEDLGVNLAVSLHAVRDDLRNVLVPLNKKYPIKDLLQACRDYPALDRSRRITFEYVMLKGVNDSLQDAKELVHLIRGIPAKVNLIPFNPWPGSGFECSTPEQISKFSEVVYKAGYASPVRTPRGRDILAACGQLKSASERERKSKLSQYDLPLSKTA